MGKASSTWTRLIHKIFEINPVLHTKCGEEMKTIAFITDFHETKKILKHIGEKTQRAPPLSLTTVSVNGPDNWYVIIFSWMMYILVMRSMHIKNFLTKNYRTSLSKISQFELF